MITAASAPVSNYGESDADFTVVSRCSSHFLWAYKIQWPGEAYGRKSWFIWAYGSRGMIHNGEKGMTAVGQSRKLRDHIFNCKHKAESELDVKESFNSQSLPPMTYILQQVQTT